MAAADGDKVRSAFKTRTNHDLRKSRAAVIDGTGTNSDRHSFQRGLLERGLLERGLLAPGPVVWRVRNKIDLLDQSDIKNEYKTVYSDKNEFKLRTNNSLKNRVNEQLHDEVNRSFSQRNEYKIIKNELEFDISATSGTGLGALLAAVGKAAEWFLAGAESTLITRARHRHTLEATLAALRRALAGPLAAREDLLAEELRLAAAALGRLTGRVDVEDILDVIFRDFCIGK
jgi:tRNA U34 5-carboxymethylaminomethyl modifying GTPase MnmE/TrmE